MKIINFGNQRGGVGKTSSAGNISYELSKYGKTLLLDADPQASLSTWFLQESEDGVLNALDGKDIKVVALRENLDILPTRINQSNLREWSDRVLPGETYAVQDMMDKIRDMGYAYVVVDLHPEATAYLERRFIAAAHEVVTVLKADTFSVRGLDNFRGAISEIARKDRATFKSDKLILNMVESRKVLHQVYSDDLSKRDITLYQISVSQDVANSQTTSEFLVEYNKKAKPSMQFAQIAEDLR